jgi:hypothetical protein
MKKTYTLIVLALIIISICACKKDNNDSIGGYDTYVLGTAENGKPVYWKNGNINEVQASNLDYIGRLRVYNGDVYIPGTMMVNNTYHAIYIKNGVITDLGPGEATDIAINGNDVFVTGETFAGNSFNATYWKNGVSTSYDEGEIDCIVISNGDVYMGGTIYSATLGTQATYWKNGVQATLQYGFGISDMAVLNGDFYAVGNGEANGNESGLYWKNGQPTIVGDSNTFLSCISISGSDVYVAGRAFQNGTVGAYWKNGNINVVSGTNNVTGIFASGNDVIMSASQIIGPQYVGVQVGGKSLLIENGKLTTLASSTPPETLTTTYNMCVVKQ